MCIRGCIEMPGYSNFALPGRGLGRDRVLTSWRRGYHQSRSPPPSPAAMTDPETSPPEDAGHLLERGRRLSESLLWSLQQRFYDSQGARAWASGVVPHYITGNGWIADSYAKVVIGWLRDCTAAATEAG